MSFFNQSKSFAQNIFPASWNIPLKCALLLVEFARVTCWHITRWWVKQEWPI